MIDWYGTPFTEALHLVERYQLLEYEATMEAIARDAKENFQFANPDNGPAARAPLWASLRVPSGTYHVILT
jgi:hypothetical protein